MKNLASLQYIDGGEGGGLTASLDGFLVGFLMQKLLTGLSDSILLARLERFLLNYDTY